MVDQDRRFEEDTIQYQSMTGVDMIAAFRFNDEYFDATRELEAPVYKTFAELQTISISSTRSVGAVRALGESAARAYTRGARTIAGSLIFTMFSKDPFEDVARLSSENEVYGREPFFLDQIPEFDIIINSVNEFGAMSKAIIGDVTLTNYGTTLSIHDIYTEISYTYVARFYIPMTHDIRALDKVRQLLTEPRGQTASDLAAASVISETDTNEVQLAKELQAKWRHENKSGRFVPDYGVQ
jgi:hypothetical protein